MSGLHDQVSIPHLLYLGGLCESVARGRNAVLKGNVFIEQWNICVAEVTLPRWVLRGVTIRIGERSLRISDDGSKILRSAELALQ